MIARWFCFAVPALLLKAVAVILSPLLALLARTAESNPWCTAPGPREYLPGWLHLFSTHDDGVDALWYQGHYDTRAPAGWPQRARDGSWLARYCLRVLWIVRNSAYGFAHHFMGFERVGMYNTLILAQHGKWDSDTTNWLYRIDTNKEGKKAFQVRAQLYFTTTNYVRVNLGWKLDWLTAQPQLATHINPLRVWKN